MLDDDKTPIEETDEPSLEDEELIAAALRKPAEVDEPDDEPDEKPDETPVKDKPAAEKPAEEKPAEEKPAVVPTDERRYTQKDFDELAGKVRAQEREAQEKAKQKLRDLEIASGLKYEELLSHQRNSRKQEAAERFAMSEEDAETYVLEREELIRLKAEREAVQKEREEEKATAAFALMRTNYLSDASTPAHLKALTQKYAADIDAFADSGKTIPFNVARDFVLGQKLNEILSSRDSVKEQQVIDNINKRSKVKPESGGSEVASVETFSRADRAELAKLGLDAKAIAEIETERSRKKK